MKLRALLLALSVAACGQAGQNAEAPAPDRSDPHTLNIEIGRYGAMLSQVIDHTAERPGAGAAEPSEPRELARSLRETVWEYNLQRSRLCAKGLFTDVACGTAYEPIWIAEPASVEPTIDEIGTRSEAVGNEVMRLWNAVCSDAASRVEDEQERMYVCPME
jgi:hypothetical protein